MHFGATLRMLRVDAGMSLRALAERVGVSSAYLSRVENGHDAAPTPDRLVAIAKVLGVGPATLVELGAKIDPLVEDYLAHTPGASSLFFEIARRRLNPAQLGRVLTFIDETFPSGGVRRADEDPRLTALLSRGSVVLQLACSDVDDVLDVAATRLAEGGSVSAATVARALREREAEASTAIGAGVLAPHAVIPSAPLALTLMVLRRPLSLDTPDGRPIRICVALVHPEGGREMLALLAQVARLAHDDVAEKLSSAREPRRVLSLVEALGV